MTEKIDITSVAVAQGWTLPAGFRVLAWSTPDEDSDPREEGGAFLTDVDEKDYDHPTHAFCKHCGRWLFQHSEHGWLAKVNTGTASAERCAENPLWPAEHEPDESVAIRWWHDDRWSFVGVLVAVEDTNGQEWGTASLWSVVAGTFPNKIDRETGEITIADIDPLTDDYPLSDLVPEALAHAQARLRTIQDQRPVITGPDQQEPSQEISTATALNTGIPWPVLPDQPLSAQTAGEHYRLAESLADDALNDFDLSDESRARLATLALVHATLAGTTPTD